MRKLRGLIVVPVLAAALVGMGHVNKASAARCNFSYYPGVTAVYSSSAYGSTPFFNVSGGAGLAAFYMDPFGVLRAASPSGPTAVYFTNYGPGYDIYGDSAVAIVCTPV